MTEALFPGQKLGAVMVVGGGIAGMQASLDLADRILRLSGGKECRHRRQDGPVGQDLPHQRLRHVNYLAQAG